MDIFKQERVVMYLRNNRANPALIEKNVLILRKLRSKSMWILMNRTNQGLEKMKRLQMFWRNRLMLKKLKDMIKILTPIYFHPDCKGGYFAKKEISEFIATLTQT